MKNNSLFFGFVFLCVAFVLPSAGYANGTNAWHSMAQWQRDQAIVTEAYKDNGKYVGLQCKAWVQQIISRASGGHVWIPLNNPPPNDYYWQNDPYGHAVGMSMPIQYVPVGWIVQMRSKGGTPHTAIVVGQTSTMVTFIDSNWRHDETVIVHTLTHVQFRNTYEGYPGGYAVYYIL